MVASVATNGVTPSLVITMPLASPMAAPTTSAEEQRDGAAEGRR